MKTINLSKKHTFALNSLQVYRDMVCVQLNEAKVQLVPWKDFVPPVRTHFGLAKLTLPRVSLGEPLW